MRKRRRIIHQWMIWLVCMAILTAILGAGAEALPDAASAVSEISVRIRADSTHLYVGDEVHLSAEISDDAGLDEAYTLAWERAEAETPESRRTWVSLGNGRSMTEPAAEESRIYPSENPLIRNKATSSGALICKGLKGCR